MADNHRPRLIIVAGPPAAGKSTSAPLLADALHMPCFSLDVIKERLADAIGTDALGYADALGDAALRQLVATAWELLNANKDVMIEGYIRHGTNEALLLPLISLADAVLLHMRAEDSTLKYRFETRAVQPDRHWIHNDMAKVGTLLPELPAEMAAPLELGTSRVFVDTTAGQPRLNHVVAQLQRALRDQVPRDYRLDVTMSACSPRNGR